MLQKEGDIPQNVNFAIKASVAATFLQSNNVKFASGKSVQTMEPPDLADLGQSAECLHYLSIGNCNKFFTHRDADLEHFLIV